MASAPWIIGRDGDDRLAGTGRVDLIDGGLGDDRLSGGAGNDVLFGDRELFLVEDSPGRPSSADRLDGGHGDDILIGGADDDVLTGGTGRDVFVATTGGSLDLAYGPDYVNAGTDVVTDFVKGQDRLAITVEDHYLDYDFDFQSFAELADHIAVVPFTFEGRTELSTIVTAGFQSPGVVVVFGVTGLTAADFVGGDRDYSPFDALTALPGQHVGSFDADHWQGTAAAERYVALHGDDEIRAGGGADTVLGNAGDDRLYGEAGDDRLEGGSGADLLDGGSGEDILIGDRDGTPYDDNQWRFPAGDEQIHGGSGDDRLLGIGGDDRLYGEAGADVLLGGNGDDRLDGGAGNDVMWDLGHGGYDPEGHYLGLDLDHMAGGEGDDILFAGARTVLVSDAGRDVFVKSLDPYQTTNYSIIMDFGRGEDRLALTDNPGGYHRYLSFAEFDTDHDGVLDAGDAGHVRIQTVTQGGVAKLSTILFDGVAATEKLVVFGVTGLTADDLVAGTAKALPDDDDSDSTNVLAMPQRYGSFDADRFQGSAQAEHVELFHGDDRAYALGGDDRVLAGAGDDVLFGGDGNDHLFGDAGQDRLYGEAGNDALSGGDGADLLKGGPGDDDLDGGAGNDRLEGGLGDDYLQGGSGSDSLTGDAGSDRFILDIGHSGRTLVTDFAHGVDQLRLLAHGDRIQSFPDSFPALDTDHDGTLGAGDRGFLVKQVEVGGVTSTALILDASKLVGAAGNAHLTVLGIDRLLPGEVDVQRY